MAGFRQVRMDNAKADELGLIRLACSEMGWLDTLSHVVAARHQVCGFAIATIECGFARQSY